MTQSILAPLDGSLLARSVLPHLVALARVNDAAVTLVRVVESNQAIATPLDPMDCRLYKIKAQAYLDEIATELRLLDLDVETKVLEGPAAERIIEYAQKNEYDLIALSSHGQGGFSGWPLGSVAQKIIQRAHKSILLIPAYHRGIFHLHNGDLGHSGYRRILVPLDGSQRADSVLSKATALARYHAAELLLVHVVAPPPLIQRLPYTAEDQDLMQRIVERNRCAITRYFDQLQTRLVPEPQTRVLESEHVASALHHLVQQENVDLVILSAHGHVREHSLPYGHLTLSLLLYAAVPLLVCQDLASDEIKPTQAELSLRSLDLSAENRLNPPEFVWMTR